MRDFVVLGIVLLSLPTVFRRPFVGLILFSWLAYMRPQDLCWGFARDMRFSFYVAVTMVIGWYVNDAHKRRFFTPDPRMYLMLTLGLLITVSLAFASQYDPLTGRYYFEFLKILAIAIFTIGQVDSRKRLRALLWTIAFSLGFYSVKNGLVGIARGGSTILRGPGGMLEDNNDFALALVMNIPLLYYLGQLANDKRIRMVTLAAIMLTAVTVLLTHSRGGFLAMNSVFLWISWRSGKLLRALVVLGVLAVLFFAFAPEHVVERIASIGKGREDDSAASRLDSWMVALRMIAANPIWGVGLRNFVISSPDFGAVMGPDRIMHVAHNSYLQIAAEGGLIAFMVYLGLLASSFTAGWFLRRVGRSRPDLADFGVYGRMFEATMLGFMVGGMFLNRGHFDLVYHVFGIIGAAVLVAQRELRQASVPQADGAHPVRHGRQAVTVRWRSPVDHLATARWERG
ncbi:MAG: putative O-glycosylation ligase, exosortase A system-associated [Planctomycetes bacterium]|nr:putative O-glycosylation ligase, exosortase A system-associated [Planctomycetota bacterium]MCB9869488.1 putative O-glycosylation ligase, exosortase A system-associated [Planctomycetota bacterium]